MKWSCLTKLAPLRWELVLPAAAFGWLSKLPPLLVPFMSVSSAGLECPACLKPPLAVLIEVQEANACDFAAMVGSLWEAF